MKGLGSLPLEPGRQFFLPEHNDEVADHPVSIRRTRTLRYQLVRH